LSSYLFADLLRLPAAMHHLVYFVVVCAFVAFYAMRTGLALRATLRRRLALALLLGALGGLVLMQRVLAEPPSAGSQGLAFVWDLLWRGVIYGAMDGVLLSAFPWLVAWRALGGESAPPARQAGISGLALGLALVVTSGYHLGYSDFRGPKLLQANIGNAIATLPTLLSRNPLASSLAHVILHVTAVIHAPQSDLFLPPHERRPVRPAEIEPIGEPSMGLIDFPLRGRGGVSASRTCALRVRLRGDHGGWALRRPVPDDLRPPRRSHRGVGRLVTTCPRAPGRYRHGGCHVPRLWEEPGHRRGREIGQLAGPARSLPGPGRTGPAPGARPPVSRA
jgi:hypothetical protein